MFRLVARTLAISLPLTPLAAASTHTFPMPADDRWHYPFNFGGGERPTASLFSSLGTGVPSFNNFNDRDGQMLVAWDTSAVITPALGAQNYPIRAVTIIITNEPGAIWPIDLTPDEWYTYDVNNSGSVNADGVPRGEPGDSDGESTDADPGRPIELFGAGFGPVYRLEPGFSNTWTEASPYVGGSNTAYAPRDPFPFVYDPAGTPLHVEDNVQVTHFTPTPWAVGVPQGYTPGSQTTPFDIRFSIDLSLSSDRVREYFQQQLDLGRVAVCITSLMDTVQGGTPGGVPSIYQVEGLALHPLAKAATLIIDLDDAPAGDLNGDGCVNLTDLATLLTNFGTPVGATLPMGDIDHDADVDLTDLATLLTNFGLGNCP